MSNTVRLNFKTNNVKIKSGPVQSVEQDNEIREINERENELNRLAESAYAKGYHEAENNVRIELEQEYTERLIEKTEEFNKILSTIEESLTSYEKDFDEIIIEVAMAIAEKIIKREISRETIITNSLRESVKRVLGANEILIRMNPQDLVSLTRNGQNNFLDDSYTKIKFKEDEAIEPGGCIAETEIGSVDARIVTQLSEIRKQLDSSFNSQTV